jgi:hypothetical protein
MCSMLICSRRFADMHLTWEGKKKLMKSVVIIFENAVYVIFSVLSASVFPMRPKARGLAQHGGPPGLLEESDQAGCIFVRDAACPDGQHRLPRSGADLLLDVHKTPP